MRYRKRLREGDKQSKGEQNRKKKKKKKSRSSHKRETNGSFPGIDVLTPCSPSYSTLLVCFFWPFILDWLLGLCMDYCGFFIIYCVYIICGLVFSVAYLILFEKHA